jgi:hypothetical protein
MFDGNLMLIGKLAGVSVRRFAVENNRSLFLIACQKLQPRKRLLLSLLFGDCLTRP